MQSIQRCLNLLFQRTDFLMFPFFKNISTPRLEPTSNKQCCLPPLSFKISLKDTSLHIFRGLSLSRTLAEFSLNCVFHHVWENFQIHGVHILREYSESRHFYLCPCSPLRTPGTTKETGGENNHILYQKSIIKYRDNTEH